MSEGLRILIVEGNPADADFIHEMLPQAGLMHFQVESVRKLSDALTRLERKDIDLVLLNLVLPDSQGLQTFHTLQKAAPEIPVIVLAGNDDHELAIAAVRDGAQDYLVKGQVSARPLIRTVRYALLRQKVADALHQSREEFKDLFDNAPIGFHEVDAEGRLVRINNTELKMLGYSAEELLGQFVWKISAEEETTRRSALAKLGGEPPSSEGFERKFRRKDGSTFPVLINDRILKRKDGAITGIHSTIQDITGRKRAEEKLKLFRALIERSVNGIHVVDPATGRFIDVNESACRDLGYTRDEMLALMVFDVTADVDCAFFVAHNMQVKKAGHDTVEVLHRRKNGTTYPVEVSLSFVTLDREYLVAIIRDITERKRAEAELNRERDLWRALLDNSPDKIYFKDTQSRLVKCSQAMAIQFGVESPDELVGKTDFDFFDESHARLAFEDEQEIIRTGRPMIAKEERVEWKDGHVTWVSSTKMPWLDGTGKIIGTMGISRNITERKQAEEALHDNEAFLNTVIEKIPHMIFVKDAKELRFVKFNKAGQELLGYSLAELAGKNDYDLFPKEMADYFTENDRKVLRGKEVVDIPEEPVQTRNKGGRILHTKKIPVFDNAGQLVYLMGISEDITEVKQSREKLRQRESFLSAITENQPGLLWLKDAEGRFLTVNKAFAAACGHSDPEQVCGLTDLDLWPKEMAEKYRNDDRRVMSTGDSSVVEEMIFIGDKYVWHETFKTPVRDDQGCVIGTTGYARDITGRKRAEQQLTEAFNFNQKIISDASVGIVVFKASGPCVLANETAARTLNATVPQILAQDFRQIASWRASGMLQFAEEALATKEPRHCESNFTSTFGKEVSLVCHFSPFVQNGEPHLLLVFNDVSEKKKLEAQFLRAQRMESIGTLAGGIAHDLNNVLAPLLISVQLLKEKVTDADGKRLLETLEANVNRGANLVKQVLIFGRGIRGERIMLQPKHIGREIEHIVRETFPKSVKFEIQFAADLWTLTGDPTQIEQVLLNLSVNARDAMPDGGKLSLHMENRVLDENYAAANLEAKPGNYVVISVTDTGAGMTREIRDRIFEPFYTTKEQGKGTGLGLSTTLAIVKSHGGFINCYSEAGKGSVFTVYLPASPGAAVARKAAAKQSSLPRGHNELVLVVDDEAPIRILAQSMLERFGYRILLAADGAEAVKLYTSHQNEIAVVITDMAMPVMDGPATIAALQAINPKVKVIGSSGLDIRDGATGIINAGLRHFMSKPYTAESMLNLLHKVLRNDPVK